MTSPTDRFPNEQPSAVSKGCLIAGAIGLVLILFVATVLFSVYQMKSARKTEIVERMTEAEARHYSTTISAPVNGGERSVVIRQEDLASFSATDFGETLTIENAVAILFDPASTNLVREVFSKTANGQEVEWALKVSDIASSKENQILADLLIPYEIASGGSTMGSHARVKAVFPGDSYTGLVNVRQGQWIRVRGKLKIVGQNFEILDPVLVSETHE